MSFQPFAVQCQTCSSRLRVTDPAIVGTIAACPKCNSMVKIDPPGARVAVGRSSVDSQAITEEGIDVADAPIDPSATSANGQRFSGSEEIDSGSTDTVTPADPYQWQSDRTRRSRQVALVVALSLAGLCSGVAIFSWFVQSWRKRSVAQMTSSETLEQETTSVSATPNEQPELSAPSTEPTSESVDADPDSENQLASREDPTLETSTPTKPGDHHPDSAPPIPSELIPQSPLAAPSLESTDDPAAEAEGMQDLPPELSKFLDVLPFQGLNDAPTLKAPPSVDDVTIEAAAEDNANPLNPPQPKQLNLKADLAIRLALDSKDDRGYRLADLMLLISQITGVPIQVDWVSFDLAGRDIDARVKIPKGYRSAGDLLQAVATEWGAEIREEQTLVTLTLSDSSFEQTMTEIADLDDFADAKASAKSVLEDFLRADPKQTDVDLAQLGKPREAQQLAALAIESMRRMRGVKPKVPDQRLRHWARSAENETVEWPLLSQGDPGPQLDAPITIAGLLRRLAKRNQATCVVNWYDANRKGVSPVQLVFPSARVDAATTLQQTLERFDVQVRSVDPSHWWIGSAATYDRLPVVVWTQPLGDQREAFTRRIEKIIAAGATRDRFRFSIDQDTDRALLLLPRFIVRQLPTISPAIAAN